MTAKSKSRKRRSSEPSNSSDIEERSKSPPALEVIMHQPPLWGRPIFAGKKVLLIDPRQPTREVRASIMRNPLTGSSPARKEKNADRLLLIRRSWGFCETKPRSSLLSIGSL